MDAAFRFDRRWVFPLAPEAFFATIRRPEDFRAWWSWLRRCEVGPEPLLGPGTSARCVVQAPLPYALRFTVTVDDLVPGELIATTVSGDLAGPAQLEVAPHAAGCAARVTWALELRDPVLRHLSRFARPAMLWAHDRVVELGVAQFERRALDATSGPGPRADTRPKR